MPANKTTLTIIVNGTATEIERNDNAPLRSVIEKALSLTGNVGQPPENWLLRDANGNELDLAKKIGSFGFPADAKLFLDLRAGVGGATC